MSSHVQRGEGLVADKKTGDIIAEGVSYILREQRSGRVLRGWEAIIHVPADIAATYQRSRATLSLIFPNGRRLDFYVSGIGQYGRVEVTVSGSVYEPSEVDIEKWNKGRE